MSQVELKRAGGIAYRDALPSQTSDRSPVLCLHGWPQSSYVWHAIEAQLRLDAGIGTPSVNDHCGAEEHAGEAGHDCDRAERRDREL